MSRAAKALGSAIQLLERFYESPSLAHTRALDLIDNELPELRAALAEAERQGMPAPYMQAAGTLCHWCQGGPSGYVCPGCIDRRVSMLRDVAAPPEGNAAQALATLRDYVERSTHWKSGGADRHAALQSLKVLDLWVPDDYVRCPACGEAGGTTCGDPNCGLLC